MRHFETPPSWATRLRERSRLRRGGNRITRWIALPVQKARIGRHSPASVAHEPGAIDWSSNDNLFVESSRVAG